MWARRLVAVVGLGASLVVPAGALGADGLDPAFGRGGVVRIAPSKLAEPMAMAPRRDGSVAVLGGRNPLPGVLALSARGAFDRAFGSGGVWSSESEGFMADGAFVAGQPNGRLVVAGSTWQDAARGYGLTLSVVQLRRSGVPDRGFADHGVYHEVMQPDNQGAGVMGLMLGPNGRILVAYHADKRFVVVALRPNGRLDRSFGDGGRAELTVPHYSRGLTARTVRGGAISLVGIRGGFSRRDFILARLKPNGKPDRRIGGDGVVLTPELDTEITTTIDSAGRALVGAVRGNSRSIYRLLPNGAMDRDFGDDGIIVTRKVPYPFTLLAAPGGDIYGAGGSEQGFSVARFGPEGKHEWSAEAKFRRSDEQTTFVNAMSFARGRLFLAGGTFVAGPGEDPANILVSGIVVRLLPPAR